MTGISVIKALLLGLFVLNKNITSTYLAYVIDPPVGATDLLKQRAVLREGGFTLIAEGILLFLISKTVSSFRPHVLSVKDVYFYKSRMVAYINLRNSV